MGGVVNGDYLVVVMTTGTAWSKITLYCADLSKKHQQQSVSETNEMGPLG
jgi:hypothetical protein